MTFYALLSRYYEEVFPCDEDLVTFVADRLKSGDQVVDAGCGTGELIRQLRQKGVNARGFDLDPDMVDRACLLLDQAGGNERGGDLICQGNLLDFSALYPAKSVRLVCCVGNTMAHIPPGDFQNFLSESKKLLQPGGYLLLQTLNYENVLLKEFPFPERRTEHCLFKRRYRKGEGMGVYYFETNLTDLESQESYRNSVKHYPLLPDRIGNLLKEAGFEDISFFGNWNGEAAGENQLPLIVLSRLP